MADLSDAQRKRAEARERRRSKSSSKSSSEGKGEDKTAQDDGASGDEDQLEGVKQAAKVAAAVGAVGAAAAAARALTHRGDGDGGEAPTEEAQDPQPQPEPEPEARDEAQAEGQRSEEDHPEPEGEPEPEREPERDSQPVAGASGGDTRKAIDRARSELEELLGRPVESVSSFERTHDGWVAALEVVEVQRIPETTDILASYELELDDDLNLRRYQQVRRYHRAQAERGEGS